MTLLWFPLPALPPPVADMTIWGAVHGRWQYVLSYDPQSEVWGASVKPLKSPTARRLDLGDGHATRAAAVAACEQHAGESK